MLVCSCVSADNLQFGFKNGDFRQVENGKPSEWEFAASLGQAGDWKYLPDGGRNGIPAVELTNDYKYDTDVSCDFKQVIHLPSPRTGAFAVKAWMRCDEIEESGDCGMILEYAGEYRQYAIPDRRIKVWQEVMFVLRPVQPIIQMKLHLVICNVKGRVRFCDVRIEDAPIEIQDFAVKPVDATHFDVRATLGELAPWTLTASRMETWYGIRRAKTSG